MTKNTIISGLLMFVLTMIATDAKAGAEDQEVTLKLRNGDMAITGVLVNHSDSSYVIKTEKFGIMALDTARFACEGPACPRVKVRLGIHGSNTIGAQLMPTLLTRYGESRGARVEQRIGGDPEEVKISMRDKGGRELAEIDLHSHGSGTSAPGLISGAAEIGMSSRPITPEELKKMEGVRLTAQPHVIALDGLLVLVSPENPVRALTLDQVAQIFSGTIKDWSQVGQAPGRINLYARDDKSGTFDTFNALVLAPRKLKISPEAKRFESTPDLSDQVARDPHGIGFGGFAYLRSAKALTIGSVCGILSQPSIFGVKTEDYPLSRRLFLYTTNAAREQLAKDVVEFSLSDQAQSAVTESGFVDLGVDLLSFSEQGDRIAGALDLPPADLTPPVITLIRQMTADMRGARRMSISFRFERGSDRLDVKARQDLFRLAKYLGGDDMHGKQVMLVGFADASGTFDGNLRLAQNRAGAVRSALLALGGSAFDPGIIIAKSYSKLMPVACNDTEADREKNRRVEVWVKG